MKKYRMILLAAIAVFFSGCVKDLEKEGFQAETELMGTVVEKSTNNPLPDIKVSITDGDHIHASTTTNQRGDFKLKVNYDELNNDYYLLLDGSPTMPFKQEELHGMGGKVYDYKTIVLYDKTNADLLPQVITGEISNVGFNTATVAGRVSSDGGHKMVVRGVCYATHQTPTLDDMCKTAGADTGSYHCNLDSLQPGTTYYVRTYATNSIGVSYGLQKTFTTTTGVPVFSEVKGSEATGTSFKVSCDITDDGGAAVTARGFCWDTNSTPTIEGKHSNDGKGTGSFSHVITSLRAGTTYYVRAYATNSQGTFYSEESAIATTDGRPTLSTTTVTDITATTAKSGGNVTDNGGYNVTARGICWNTMGSPDLNDQHTSNGSGNGTFTSNMTGLVAGATYHVRAYATNSCGTSYGNELVFSTSNGSVKMTIAAATNITATSASCSVTISNDGGAAITKRGICWSTSQYPTTASSNVAVGSGTGAFNASMSNLSPNTTYYVRAYAVNAAGTSYSNQISFATKDGLPTVTTGSVSNVTANSAACSGNVSSDGGFAVTAKGLCWGTTQNPTVSGSKSTDGSSTGSFNGSMTNLKSNTTYYVRAYATNSIGTVYGDQKNFVTTMGLPILTTATTSATSVSISSGGNITSDGGYAITARGVCYSTTNSNPTISDSRTTSGTGTGSFSSTITKVSVNTTYYVRAYATNSIGTAYGNVVNVKTGNGLPTVTTTTPSLNGTTVSTGGNVTNDGGYAVTARGVCYGSLPYPDLTANYKHTTDGSGTGYYASTFNLPQGSGKYYVRAYATNANGTTYGTQMTVVHPYDTLPTFQYNGHTYRVAPDPHTKNSEYISWGTAANYCKNLTAYGYSDWRMPTLLELQQMYQLRMLIGGWKEYYTSTSNTPCYPAYWSSDTYQTSSYHYAIHWTNGSTVCYTDLNTSGKWWHEVTPYYYLLAHVRPIRLEK
ncbi:MAG: DUF1566 domain-containing protein [Bacteroidales bacterium]|nr:DUF1566 domain-containing protein [Bacteroidales bacterium]